MMKKAAIFAVVACLAPWAAAGGLDIPDELGRGIDGPGLLDQNQDDSKKVPQANPKKVGTVSGYKAGSPPNEANRPFGENQGVVVKLKNGGRIEGLYLGEEGGKTWVGIGAGKVGLSPEDIASKEFTRNSHQEFKEREGAVDPKDAKALWDLALWAEGQGLSAYADKTAERVINLEPDHEQARRHLGYEKVEGRWLKGGDLKRAKGFVEFEGRWVTPEQKQAVLDERAARKAEREAREKEREAQARERALREAEAEREERIQLGIQPAPRRWRRRVYGGGYWYGGYPYGGGVIIVPGGRCQPRPHCEPRVLNPGGHCPPGAGVPHHGGNWGGGCPQR